MESLSLNRCCNICGKPFDIFDRQAAFRIHNRQIGYGSIHDGQACDLNLCCACFDRLIASLNFAISPFSDEIEYISDIDDNQIVLDGWCS